MLFWYILRYHFDFQSSRCVIRYNFNVIKLASDLVQVGGFIQETPVSSTNKTDSHDITEIFVKQR
jgi:hypothetical protein